MAISSQNLVLNTIYIDPKLDDKLSAEALSLRVNRSDLIRYYIELGLKAAEDQAVRIGSGDARKHAVRKAGTRVADTKK